MRGALAMSENSQIGILAKQRTACTSMVKMNVGEKYGVQIRNGKSQRVQLRA